MRTPARPGPAVRLACALLALASTPALALADGALELRPGLGYAARLVLLPGTVAPAMVQEGHLEVEATWRLEAARVGLRVGLLTTLFRPYAVDLVAVYRSPAPPDPALHPLLAASLGVQIGNEPLGATSAPAPLAAILSGDLGFEGGVGPGRLGLWLRLQLKTPTAMVISPGLGLFLGYAF